MEHDLKLNLHDTQWDCCVLGNGVASLWTAHWLWSSGKNTVWITSEEPYSPERAMLQHGWFWDLSPEQAAPLREKLKDAEASELPAFEAVYFDARSSKRFRKFGECRTDWGAHEKDLFEKLAAGATGSHFDLWDWQSRLHALHDTGQAQGPSQIELSKPAEEGAESTGPRFVRAQGWPLVELKTENGKLVSVVLSAMSKTESVEVRAEKFYLGDYDESFPHFIKNGDDADILAAALKGKAYRAGFGLRLWHKELPQALTQLAVIPLVVNPEKDAGSHVAGRFVQRASGLESLWIGLLTDEELEDNNEILKKIKQAKRAIERAVPGFNDSIAREAVTFEPRMFAADLVKKRKYGALGATLICDHFGTDVAAIQVGRVINGVDGVEQSEVKEKASKSRKRAPEAEPVL